MIPFRTIRADHVEPGVTEILAKAQAAIHELSSLGVPPTYANTIGALDEITQEVGESLNPIHHLLSVAETPELREAFNTVLPEIARFWSKLPLNEELWKRLKSFAETPEARGTGRDPGSTPGKDPSGIPAGRSGPRR